MGQIRMGTERMWANKDVGVIPRWPSSSLWGLVATVYCQRDLSLSMALRLHHNLRASFSKFIKILCLWFIQLQGWLVNTADKMQGAGLCRNTHPRAVLSNYEVQALGILTH